jgi:metallo-beta-lactamase family protein
MRVEYFGAAGEVTGSCHLVHAAGRRVLLDCGMVQGGREEYKRNLAPFPFEPGSLDAVVLSHAHIDHLGRLPLLVKRGFAARSTRTPRRRTSRASCWRTRRGSPRATPRRSRVAASARA